MLKLRNKKGSALAELGPALFVIFFMFFFPLLDIGTFALRYALLNQVAHLAASAGAKSNTFLANSGNGQLSATNIATNTTNNAISGMGGIKLVSCTVSILTVPNSGTNPSTLQSTPLTAAANLTTNTYCCVVSLTAILNPLVLCPNNHFIMNIPGFNVPITSSAKSTIVFENVQGLIQ